MQPDPQMFQRDLYLLQIWLNLPNLQYHFIQNVPVHCSYRISCKNHSSHPANNPQEKERSSWDCEEKKSLLSAHPGNGRFSDQQLLWRCCRPHRLYQSQLPVKTKSKIPIRQTMTSAIFATATALECSRTDDTGSRLDTEKGTWDSSFAYRGGGWAEHCSVCKGTSYSCLRGKDIVRTTE